jgi:uncharacterized membrane protein HdeD (DUF308 family)
MLETISSRWWLMLVRGIAGIVFAIAAVLWPQITLPVLTTLFGVYALIDGVIAIGAATSPLAAGRWWALLIEGILGIVVAFLVFTEPAMSQAAFVIAVGLWSLFTGVLEIIAGIQLRDVVENEWMYVLAGIVSILFGVLVLRYPQEGAIGVVWLFAGYAFMFGVLAIALSYRLQQLHSKLQQAHPA